MVWRVRRPSYFGSAASAAARVPGAQLVPGGRCALVSSPLVGGVNSQVACATSSVGKYAHGAAAKLTPQRPYDGRPCCDVAAQCAGCSAASARQPHHWCPVVCPRPRGPFSSPFRPARPLSSLCRVSLARASLSWFIPRSPSTAPSALFSACPRLPSVAVYAQTQYIVSKKMRPKIWQRSMQRC